MNKSMYFFISALYNNKMVKRFMVGLGHLVLKCFGFMYYMVMIVLLFIWGLVRASKGRK